MFSRNNRSKESLEKKVDELWVSTQECTELVMAQKKSPSNPIQWLFTSTDAPAARRQAAQQLDAAWGYYLGLLESIVDDFESLSRGTSSIRSRMVENFEFHSRIRNQNEAMLSLLGSNLALVRAELINL